jgi:hypothetical protein
MLLQYSLTPQGKIGHSSNRKKIIQIRAKSSIRKSILCGQNVYTELFDELFYAHVVSSNISRTSYSNKSAAKGGKKAIVQYLSIEVMQFEFTRTCFAVLINRNTCKKLTKTCKILQYRGVSLERTAPEYIRGLDHF